MFTLFATLEEASGLFPDNFWHGLLGSTVYFVLALLLFPIAYKFVSWITPGDLNSQLLGLPDPKTKQGDRPPNVALALVVSAMLLGMCIILAAAIH